MLNISININIYIEKVSSVSGKLLDTVTPDTDRDTYESGLRILNAKHIEIHHCLIYNTIYNYLEESDI